MRTGYQTCLFLSNYAVSVCFSCQKAALIVKKRKAAAETTALRWILYHSFSGNLKGTVPVILYAKEWRTILYGPPFLNYR